MSDSKSGFEKSSLRKLLMSGKGRIHFVGVLGISMSSIAAWCIERGFTVSGSDIRASGETKIHNGVRMLDEDEKQDLIGADLLVYSLAIPYNNKERKIARENHIPEISRPEMLGAIMMLYEIRIGVSGTHGKSTTSAMIYHILRECGKDPTAFIGAKINGDKSYFIGGDKYFVYEACEYKDAFLHFEPNYAIITSVELDHTDYFSDISVLRESFVRSVRSADKVYISTDIPGAHELGDKAKARSIEYYGVMCTDGYSYRIDSFSLNGTNFTVYHHDREIGSFSIPIPGEYNVRNALVAIALAIDIGIGACQINRALSTFFGIDGRMEYIGDVSGRRVYMDYAHHPTAVRETITLMKSVCERVTVVFRPHTYTRTRDFAKEFADSLSIADSVIITDIYPAREDPIPGVDAEWLASLTRGGVYKPIDRVADWVLSFTDGVVILMGAGDLSLVKMMIFKT